MHFSPFLVAFGLCLAALPPIAARAEGRSILVLDASGSMWGQIDGRAKLEIAREALGSVLAAMPAETELGLMAYGHREKGSCEDIELIVPPAAGTAGAITDAANALKFLGKTPLSEAVRRAAAELRSTEEKATVILITDGIETCNADPCALGLELEQTGVDFTAHVVGFGLTADEGRQVACLAENTGGKYIEAKDASSLVEALQTAVVAAEPPPPAPEPEPEPVKIVENVDPVLRLVAGGDEVTGDLPSEAYFDFLPLAEDGTPGESVATIYGALLGQVPAGRYLMRTTLHKAVVEQEVEVSDSALSTPEAVLDAGVLSLRILAQEGGDPAPGSAWDMRGAGGVGDYGYEQTRRVFPTGEYELTTTLGEMEAKEVITIVAGEVLDKTVVLGIGIASFTAYYAEGIPVDGAQSFDIFEAKAGLDGNRANVRSDYGAGVSPQLAPGDYVVVGQAGSATAEVAFTVKPGQSVEVPVVLNAGVAQIIAPNASSLEIFAAKVGLDGNRTSVRTDYGESAENILPAGDYVVVARVDEVSAEGAFTVKPAERVEVNVALSAGMAAISAPGATEIEIFSAKVGLDGKRERIRGDYSEASETMLPPGDYLAVGQADKALGESPFSIRDGERTEISVDIPRGVLAIAAQAAREITVYLPPDALSNKRERISGDYGEVSESTLSPGNYLVVADFGDGIEVEQTVTLANGQRLELQIAKP